MRSKTSKWFECTVSVSLEDESGTLKKTFEKYVVDALSFSEAESIVIDKVVSPDNEVPQVKSIVPAPYKQIFYTDSIAYPWFKVKVKYIIVDEKSGKEKGTNVVYLVQGEDISSVKASIEKELDNHAVAFVITGINNTTIVDVISYDEPF